MIICGGALGTGRFAARLGHSMKITLDSTLVEYLIYMVFQFATLLALAMWLARRNGVRLQYGVVIPGLFLSALIFAFLEVQMTSR